MENKMVCEETEYEVDFDKYDAYLEAMAEKEDRAWEDYDE